MKCKTFKSKVFVIKIHFKFLTVFIENIVSSLHTCTSLTKSVLETSLIIELFQVTNIMHISFIL